MPRHQTAPATLPAPAALASPASTVSLPSPAALSVLAALAGALLLPAAARAHPHVFIDAALVLDYDAAGQLVQVEVEWAYDAFYSLLIIEDLGLDPDGDGVLTPAEEAALQGFDAEWEPGFDGRLYLRAGQETGQEPVALEPPRGFGAAYRDGRLISRHVRPLARPLEGARPLVVQVYDPEFYVQFALPEPPAIRGASCRVDHRVGDPFAAADAYARAVAEALAEETDSRIDQDMLIVDIGPAGADRVDVRCEAAP